MSRLLRNRSRDAAFLCYHSVHDDGPEWLSISPSLFERQLQHLAGRGWRSGTEADLQAVTTGSGHGGPKAFLTFDDGFADNFDNALPILQEYGFAGMFFLLPGHLDGGDPFTWPEVADARRNYPDVMRSLTWRQVEAMAEAGMEFGSHGLTHSHLPDLTDEELTQELLESRRLIADRLGHCSMLAYPFGEWDQRVADAAAAAGYDHGFTLPRAYQGEACPLTIPRISIDHRDEPMRFGLKMRPVARRLYLSRSKALLRAGGFVGLPVPTDELAPPVLAGAVGGMLPL